MMPPLSVIAAMLFLFSSIYAISMYLGFKYMALRLGMKLRNPPVKDWNEVLQQAYEANVKTLATFGSVFASSPSIRRQLILASSNPSAYTCLATSKSTLALHGISGKTPFKPQYDANGTRINRKVIFGFFHPHANAGGGGERVLWAAVRQTLLNDPLNICAIYMGMQSTNSANNTATIDSPENIFEKVQSRFGIEITDRNRMVFIYIPHRTLIDPKTWPRFTMLGQAIGSILLAYTAISALVPDVFIDTTGLPFCYPMVSWVLQIPIVAYVHYPVVSTDMLKKLKFLSPKYIYWRILMVLYAIAGKYATVPLCNSTWTYNHVKGLWWLSSTNDSLKLSIVHPPCATQDFDKALVLDETKKRKPIVVYVAQFRPEKRHDLVLKEFSKFLNEYKSDDKPHLVLIGTVRDNDQDKSKVYSLRLLARELNLTSEHITFLLDAPWKNVQDILSSSSFGLNAMWNEHFGMVVVEYMAAGLIPIVHNSGGPKLDLVKERDGVIPGFLFSADSDPDYNKEISALSLSESFKAAFELDAKTAYKYQQVVFEYAQRFSDKSFADEWDVRVNALLKIDKLKRRKRLSSGRFD